MRQFQLALLLVNIIRLLPIQLSYKSTFTKKYFGEFYTVLFQACHIKIQSDGSRNLSSISNKQSADDIMSGKTETWYNGFADDEKRLSIIRLFQVFIVSILSNQLYCYLCKEGIKLSPTETIGNYTNDVECYSS